MACCTVSTDTSFLAIPSTSPHALPSLAYVTTKLFPPSYQLAMLSETNSRLSSPSYILREFVRSLFLCFGYRDLDIYSDFEAHELSYEQWKSVVHLSTRWGFTSRRKLALNSIKPPTSHDQLVLVRRFSVDHWVLPSLTALCERTLPLSLDEARQMCIEDVILVATVREETRSGALRVDTADIARHVEVAQAGKPNGFVGSEVKAEAEAEAEAEAMAEAKREAEAKAEAEAEAKAEAKAKAKADAEAKEKAEEEAKAKSEADAKVRAEVETLEKARAEAREKERREAEAKAKEDGGEGPGYKLTTTQRIKAKKQARALKKGKRTVRVPLLQP